MDKSFQLKRYLLLLLCSYFGCHSETPCQTKKLMKQREIRNYTLQYADLSFFVFQDLFGCVRGVELNSTSQTSFQLT